MCIGTRAGKRGKLDAMALCRLSGVGAVDSNHGGGDSTCGDTGAAHHVPNGGHGDKTMGKSALETARGTTD